MNFKEVLSYIAKNFEKNKIRYGLIGGFSLGILGIIRTTVDLDFLIDRRDLSKVDKIMEEKGYRCVFKTENVSQYISDDPDLGEVDFLHAFRKYSLKMLERALKKRVFKNEITVKVLRPEDIIGLKIQALVNDPEREHREYADIGDILSLYGDKIDWGILKEYFSLFKLEKKFKELEERYKNVN